MGAALFVKIMFVVAGFLAVLAGVFNWDWFFKSRNTAFLVRLMGLKLARLFYVVIGMALLAMAFWIIR